MLSVTWPLDTPYVISYWWSFGTESIIYIQPFSRYWALSEGHDFDLTGSRDVIGHVTIWYPICHFYWWSFGTKPLSLTVSGIFNVECNAVVNMTFIRPINKGEGHSFWYQLISHIRLPMAVNSNFCSRTHRLATIRSVQTATDATL